MLRKEKENQGIYGGLLKWWYPMVFPTKNDHFGVFWDCFGGTTI